MASLKEIAWRTGLATTIAAGSVGIPAIIEQQKGGVLPSTQLLTNLLNTAEAGVNFGETPLTKESARAEFLNYYLPLINKYTLKDGSYRLQLPGEDASHLGNAALIEAVGEYFGGTGRIIENNVDMLDDVVKRANAEIASFGPTLSNPDDLKAVNSILKGIFYGRGIFQSKTNEFRVDINGKIDPKGVLAMQDFWVQKLGNLLNTGGDLPLDLAIERASAKIIFETVFPGNPDFTSTQKDLQVVKASELGDGVFVDKLDPGPVDRYTATIWNKLYFLHRYIPESLSVVYSADQLRNMAIPLINNLLQFTGKDGKVMFWDPRSDSTADGDVLKTLLDMSAEYTPDKTAKINALFRQVLLSVAKGGDFVYPGLSPDAAVVQPGTNKATATASYLKNLGYYLNMPGIVYNSGEADPTPAKGGHFWEKGGILGYVSSEGKVRVITLRSAQGAGKQSFVKVWDPDFPPATDPWLGDRPANYGDSALRYWEGAPGNLLYLVRPSEFNFEIFENGVGFYAEGDMDEFADGLGKQGRKTDIKNRRIIGLFDNGGKIDLNSYITPPGKTIAGVNNTSAPLSVDKHVSPDVKNIANGWQVSYGGRSVIGFPVDGIDIAIPAYRFGDLPGSVALLFGGKGQGNSQNLGTISYNHKDTPVDPNFDLNFIKIQQVDSNRVVFTVGGKKYYADFGERNLGREFSVVLGSEQKFDNWQIPNTPDGHISSEYQNGLLEAFMSSGNKSIRLEGRDIFNLALSEGNPILSPRGWYDYVGITQTFRLPNFPSNVMFAFGHGENHSAGATNFKAKIFLVRSNDNGRTWDQNNMIDLISGQFPYDINEPKVNGAGEPTAVIKDNQIYMYYVDWTSGRTQLKLARAPITDFMRPGSWTVYPEPVINAPSGQDGWAALPVVDLDSSGHFRKLFETNLGIYLATSLDGIHWSKGKSVLQYPWPTSEGSSIRYHSFYKETDSKGLLIYSRKNGNNEAHFPMYRPIELTLDP